MSKYVLIILVILLIVGIFLHSQSKKEIVTLSSDLDKQEELVGRFQEETGIIPQALAITKLEEASALNDKERMKALALFDTKEEELPVDVSDKGIYFFESLHASLKLLEREATSKKMILPPVDFSVDIPQKEDIPYLLKQIEMIDDIMGIIVNVGKCEIITIRPTPIDKTKKIFDFNKLSIQIVLKIDSDFLIKVLLEFNRHIPIYLVEEFSAVAIEPNRVKVSFVASRILTGLSLEDISEFKNKQIFDLDDFYPADIDFDSFSERNPFFRDKDLIKETSSSASSPPTTPVPTKGGKPIPQFTYKGSINMKDKLVGIIEDNWQKKVCFAALGDVCSGYKVTKIEDRKAILFKDNQEIILTKGVK